MVFKWWRKLHAGLFDEPGLVAVTLTPMVAPQPSMGDQRCDGVIEVRLGKATMRIQGRPD
jgi:hypothetical protein